MEEQDQKGSGAPNQNAGGAASGDAATGQNQPDKLIKPEDHRRAVDDMIRYKKQANELGGEISSLKAQLGDLQTKILEKDQDWKKIAEVKSAEVNDWKSKYEKSNKAFVGTQVFNAIQAKAMAAGIRPEAMPDLELLSHDGVGVEVTQSGRMIVSGAEEYVEKLKASRSHWFKAPEPPTVNSGGSGSAGNYGGDITAAMLYELEKKKDPKYPEMVAKYQKQQKAKRSLG